MSNRKGSDGRFIKKDGTAPKLGGRKPLANPKHPRRRPLKHPDRTDWKGTPDGKAPVLHNVRAASDREPTVPPVALPVPQTTPSSPAARGPDRPVSEAPAREITRLRCDPREADRIVTAPESEREAWRLLVLGDSGTGKSQGIKALLSQPWERGITVIHDDTKRVRQYLDLVGVRSVVCDSLAAAPDDAQVITFYRDPRTSSLIEPDYVCQVGMWMGQQGAPVRVVLDELDRALTKGGKSYEGFGLLDVCARGRALEVSLIAQAQNPLRVPADICNLATAAYLYRLGPRALNYLDAVWCFDREMLAVIPTLQKFEFVLHVPSTPWNGRIYYREPVAAPRFNTETSVPSVT